MTKSSRDLFETIADALFVEDYYLKTTVEAYDSRNIVFLVQHFTVYIKKYFVNIKRLNFFLYGFRYVPQWNIVTVHLKLVNIYMFIHVSVMVYPKVLILFVIQGVTE